MLLRRSISIAAVLATVACAASVPDPEASSPTSVDTAVFDPANSKIPLPNDLVFQAVDALPPSAQKDLLEAFKAQGAAFPNDQEVAITIDFQKQVIDPNTGAVSLAPTTLDPTKIVFCPAANCNIAVLESTGTAVKFATLSAPVAADYVVPSGADHGTLTLHNAPHTVGGVSTRRWNAGSRYIVAVRGGAAGVQASTGPVYPSATFFLLLQDKNLNLPVNQSLVAGAVTKANPNATQADIAAAAAQLEALRQGYLTAFGAVDGVFPHGELAIMTTFAIQGLAEVQIDPELGVVPLPSDFLLDSTGHVQNIAAFGALAPGIHTLDGFSTTGTILAATSGAVVTSTVNSNTVFVYKYVTNASGAVTGVTRLVDVAEALGVSHDPTKAKYITMPSPITGGAPAVPFIALQPAEPVAVTGVPPFTVPPLEENTEYAVIVTDGVQDAAATAAAGKPVSIGSATGSKLALATHALLDGAGHPLVTGLDAATAVGLETLRQALNPVIGQLAVDKGITRDHVRTAYTFKTQTISGRNSFNASGQIAGKDPGVLGLAALPYGPPSFVPAGTFGTTGTVNTLTATAAFAKYGIEHTLDDSSPGFPAGAIGEVLETTITTVNLLSPATGAFSTSGGALEKLNVLITVPTQAAALNAPFCPGTNNTVHCLPLVVWHHGLGDSRESILIVANSFNAQGMVVAAIDSPKHGDRAWCDPSQTGAATQCLPPYTCVADPALAGQGDPAGATPGHCLDSAGKPDPSGFSQLVHVPRACATAGLPGSATCVGQWDLASGGASGHALASANFLVSANFFRTRDSFRQDVLDNSALILAIAPPPGTPSSPVATHLIGEGFVVNPAAVYWVGQSLGSILGTINVAANPRISEAVLNVGGGTITDIFTQAPSFQSTVGALLASLHLTPGTAAYLQFIIVAKWILDPADPINFAGHVTATGATLPNLLSTTGPALQTPKKVLAQIAHCDATVPNPFNVNLDLDLGTGPLFTGANPGLGTLTTFFDNTKTTPTANACPVTGGSDALRVPHAFITSWGISGAPPTTPDAAVRTLAGAALGQGAAFLVAPTTLPSNVVALP